MNLTLTDLSLLIPLIEKELDALHEEIESANQDVSDDASEISVLYGETASKLEGIYRSLWEKGCNFPSYEELIASNQRAK